MILTKDAIRDAVRTGDIRISPFRDKQLNEASYDVRLSHKKLTRYTSHVLDSKNVNLTSELPWIMDDAKKRACFVLQPGELYLASTFEKVGSDVFVPILDGKSSLGRLGVSIHQTAGYGEPGFHGCWTLEISVLKPTILYVGQRIGQFRFHQAQGEITKYTGRYSNYDGPIASRTSEQMTEDEAAMEEVYECLTNELKRQSVKTSPK